MTVNPLSVVTSDDVESPLVKNTFTYNYTGCLFGKGLCSNEAVGSS